MRMAINPADRRWVFCRGGADEMRKLEKKLNKIPPHMFLPSYTGPKKPSVFLHRDESRGLWWFHSGLIGEVWEAARSASVKVEGYDKAWFSFPGPGEGELEACVAQWGLSIEPRPYQFAAAREILSRRMSLSQIATRAGKTLIAYIVFRWLKERRGVKRILMIVPNVSLVRQAAEDFAEWGDYFKIEQVCAGAKPVEAADITVGTFQSLVLKCDPRRGNKKYDPAWFEGFDCVLLDEAHTAVCRSVDLILNQPFVRDAKLRFGFSGSLPDPGSIEAYCCHALMGPKVQDITARELADGGFITRPAVHQVVIGPEETEDLRQRRRVCAEYLCGSFRTGEDGGRVQIDGGGEFTRKWEKTLPAALRAAKETMTEEGYDSALDSLMDADGAKGLVLEHMLQHTEECVYELIVKLAENAGGSNTIVFAHHTEYIAELERRFREAYPDRPVWKITGTTQPKRRKRIQDELAAAKGGILVASYGCVGTGLTLKNIDYGIFAEGFKSKIINKQSIGRGLCLAPGKDLFRLWDVCVRYESGRMMRLGDKRRRLWEQEGFDCERTEWSPGDPAPKFFM